MTNEPCSENDYMDEKNESYFTQYTKRLIAAAARGDPIAQHRLNAPDPNLQRAWPTPPHMDDGYCSYLEAS